MIQLIAGAGVAGLVGSLHCIGMCGCFAVACGGSARESFFWHAGRLTTYVVLGEDLAPVMAARDQALGGHLAAEDFRSQPRSPNELF